MRTTEGQAVRLAREIRGLAAKDLAKKAGISPSRLSRLEGGRVEPAAEELAALAAALDMPTQFFRRAGRGGPLQNPQYRGQARIRAADRRRVEALASIFETILDELSSRSRAVSTNHGLPTLGRGPEASAAALRSQLGLDDAPIPNMVELLEGLGVWVHVLDAKAREIDAFSFWDGSGRPHVVLNHFKADAYRSRFDAAHELMHLVAHRGLAPSRELEKEANAFAGCFLVPGAAWLGQSPQSSNPYDYLPWKKHWRVSAAMLIRRSFTLEVISEGQYKSAMVRYSMLRWRTGEPGMLNVLHERPQRFHRMLSTLEEQARIPIRWLKTELGIPDDVVETLLG